MQPADQRYLLEVAADALRRHVCALPPRREPYENRPDDQPRGAFVTLRTGRRLRGCIGAFHPCDPLPATVAELAVSAAQDPRLTDDPLRPDDLADLRITISVLSPLVRTTDPLSLRVGEHGIYLRIGGRTGCFLPQVAPEAGWNAETLLSACCEMKLDLDRDAWRDEQAEVYLFTAEAFSAQMSELITH